MNKIIKYVVSVLSFSPIAVSAAIKDIDGEQNDWQIAQKENTASAYTKYLLDHPDGKYSDQAHQALDENTGQSVSQKSNLDNTSDFELKVDPDSLNTVIV